MRASELQRVKHIVSGLSGVKKKATRWRPFSPDYFLVLQLPSPLAFELTETICIPSTESFTIFTIAVTEMFRVVRVEAAMVAGVFAPSIQTVVITVLLLTPLHAIIFLAVAFGISSTASFTILT